MQIKPKSLKTKSELAFTVSFEATELAGPYQKVLNQAIAETEIKGFRKGKAPANIIEEKMGKGFLFEKIIEGLLDGAVTECIKQANNGESLLGQPKITVTKAVPVETLELEIEFATVPEIKLGDIKKLSTKLETPTMGEDEIDMVLQDLREYRATEKEKSPEDLIVVGDRLVIDFSITKDHVAIEGGTARDYSLITGRGALVPDFEKHFIGKHSGDKFEFKFEYPKEYFEKSLAGQSADATVTIKQAFTRTLPALDDQAWLQDVARVDSVEALRKIIKDNILAEKTELANQKFEKNILEELVKISTISEVSNLLVDQEINRMLRELQQDLQTKNMTWVQYLAQIKKTEQQLRSEMTNLALKRIHVSLVLEALSKKEKINATEDEVSNRINEMKQSQLSHLDHTDHSDHSHPEIDYLDSPYMRHIVQERLKSEKTLAWLKHSILKK